MGRSEKNLMQAFAAEAMIRCRYLFYARQAEREGHGEVAKLFRSLANSRETAHAIGHLMSLEKPKSTKRNLREAMEGELYAAAKVYPKMAQQARKEKKAKLARWFEGLAKAEQMHAQKFKEALAALR